jgi:chloramphenicol 3-O phosphotransferase
MNPSQPGVIVVLNGAPRSGKSSIAEAIQDTFDGVWMNLGVDVYARHITPTKYRPGIGLRPGGERPELEPLLAQMYAALYESAAAHSRLGLNVVMDVGHHDSYSSPMRILPDCAKRLAGLPAILVGVYCPLKTILERRAASEGTYVSPTPEDPIPQPVRRWQTEVHQPGTYDLEVDTSKMSPTECADAIARFLVDGTPTAFHKLASLLS